MPNGISHDAVEANDTEYKSDTCEAAGQPCGGSMYVGDPGIVNSIRHTRRAGDGYFAVDLVDRGGNRSEHCLLLWSDSHYNRKPRFWILVEGHIQHWHGRLFERAFLDVFDDAHDLHWRFRGPVVVDRLPDRLLPSEIPVREAAIDDGHSRLRGVVGLAKMPPADELRLHSCEVMIAHLTIQYLPLLAAIGVAYDSERGVSPGGSK